MYKEERVLLADFVNMEMPCDPDDELCRHEVWICPENQLISEVQGAGYCPECERVEHNGDIVWACSIDPLETMLPAQWQPPEVWASANTPAEDVDGQEEEANEGLFRRLKDALPKLNLKRHARKLRSSQLLHPAAVRVRPSLKVEVRRVRERVTG